MKNPVKSPSSTPDAPYSWFTRLRKEWIEPILIAVVLVFIIKTFIVQNFKIPTSSMEDTLLIGDHLFASKFVYGAEIPFTHTRLFKLRDPRPGDIVVFKFPDDGATAVRVGAKEPFIKRCIAVAGQTVEVRNKQVFVDGILQTLPEDSKFVDPAIRPSGSDDRDYFGPFTIPEGCLFAMGDNRDKSWDSRYWGVVPYENLKGKALFIYWSIDPDVPFYRIDQKIRWRRTMTVIR